jgi:hypothetical protein
LIFYGMDSGEISRFFKHHRVQHSFRQTLKMPSEGLPETYRKSGEVTASYDFVDVASGTGYITFYAGATDAGKVLSNNIFYSNYICIDTNGSDAAYTKIIDEDFDVLLNKPFTLRGMGIVTASLMVGTGGGTAYGKLLVRLRKWDGATETEIAASGYGFEISTAAATVYETSTLQLTIPVTTRKRGEYLRLTIEGWEKNNPGGGGGNRTDLSLGTDPMARTVGRNNNGAADTFSSDYPSIIKFQCPVRIDI